MSQFDSISQAGRYIFSSHYFGFKRNPPAENFVCFVRAVLAIANADGVISDEEKSFAKASAMVNGISLKDFEDITAQIQCANLSDVVKEVITQLKYSEGFFKRAGRSIMFYAALVATQDGLHATESETLYAVCDALNIRKEEVKNLIDLAVRDCHLTSEKVQTLFPSGSPYHKKPTMDYNSIEQGCRGYWAYVTFGMTEVPDTDLSSSLIRAALAVAAADGVLSDVEKRYAMAAAIVSGFSRKQFTDFVKEVDSYDDKARMASELLSQLPETFHRAALYYACYIASVDQLHERELEAIEKTGTMLGLEAQVVSSIVALMAKEKKLFDERLVAFFQECSAPPYLEAE